MRKAHYYKLCLFVLALCLAFSTAKANEKNICNSAIKDAAKSNAIKLLDGAVNCAQSKKKKETNFLILLGQIRAITDMTIFRPANESAEADMADLYSKIYYQFGGLGFDEIYRDSQKVDDLVANIETANVKFEEGYDPGWSYKASSKTDLFDVVYLNSLRHRIWQMRNFALKIQNDAYYDAYLKEQALRSENPVYEEGTPVYEEYKRLNGIMREASEAVQQLPPPQDRIPGAVYRRLNEPDADESFVQIHKGFNGPKDYSVDVFRSTEAIRSSWLAQAFSSSELEALIARIDFEIEYLFSQNFGELPNASGSIYVNKLEYDEQIEGYRISVRIGVVPQECNQVDQSSYPFVLATAPAVEGANIRSRSRSNFPDECGPIQSGKYSSNLND